MRILIVGSHVNSAMFVLSSCENSDVVTIINYAPDSGFPLMDFVNVCNQSYVENAVNIYNKTPWSEMYHLVHAQDNGNVLDDDWDMIKKINRMCGWSPDAMIYLYGKDSQLTETLIDITTNQDIQVFSINTDDIKFEINLKILIRNIKTQILSL